MLFGKETLRVSLGIQFKEGMVATEDTRTREREETNTKTPVTTPNIGAALAWFRCGSTKYGV